MSSNNSPGEKLRTAWLTIRSFIFLVGFVFVTVVMCIFFILVYPLLPIRGRHLLASIWCSSVLGWLRICCGVRYQIEGLENLPKDPVVILANHQSTWEAILFYKLVFPVSPILKKELLNIPLWGWAMRLQKPIAIDRSKPREAVKSLLSQGVDRIRNGNSVIIFPEGTRSEFPTVKRFSKGGVKLAIAAGVDIVPIAHNAGYCWPARKFIKQPGLIKVVIGSKIPTESADVNHLSKEIENWVTQQVASLD